MRTYDVVHHPAFKTDLRRIADRDPWRIDDILAALEAASVLLRQFPELGHRVQINGTWSVIRRSWALGDTGYVIHYRVEHDEQRIVLLRFRHEAQRPLKR